MKKVLICFTLFLGSIAVQGQYNPSAHTAANKPIGIAQAVPTDARSYFYDASLFTYRPYQSTAEVLSYLNLPKYRYGHFPIYVTGTNGAVSVYWFRNGTANSDLVPMESYTSSVAAGITAADTAAWGTARTKQPTLVSGVNIKTVNGTSIIGSGNISTIQAESDPVFGASAAKGITGANITSWNAKQPALVSGSNIKTINGTSVLGSGDISVVTDTAGLSGRIDYLNSERLRILTQQEQENNSRVQADETLQSNIDAKQNLLLSGSNIKTINGTSVLGSGNISTTQTETDPVFGASAANGITLADLNNWNAKQNALVSGTNIKTINGQTVLGSGDITIAVPEGGWGLSGNAATAGSSFLGTTNNTSLRFRTNNVQRLVVDSNGTVAVNRPANVPMSSYISAFRSYAPSSPNYAAAVEGYGENNVRIFGAYAGSEGAGGPSSNFIVDGVLSPTSYVMVGEYQNNPSAQVAINTTTRGFLLPRLTTTQRNDIATPATGLQVYNTSTNTLDFYNGTGWFSLAVGGSAQWTATGGNLYSGITTPFGLDGSTNRFDAPGGTGYGRWFNLTNAAIQSNGTIDISAGGAQSMDITGSRMTVHLPFRFQNSSILPTGVAGLSVYNSSNIALAFHNGTQWVHLGGVGPTPLRDNVNMQPTTGMQWYNTTTGTMQLHNGTAWVDLISTGALGGDRTIANGDYVVQFTGGKQYTADEETPVRLQTSVTGRELSFSMYNTSGRDWRFRSLQDGNFDLRNITNARTAWTVTAEGAMSIFSTLTFGTRNFLGLGGAGQYGLWLDKSSFTSNNYSIYSDTDNTFVNAQNSGALYFRTNNGNRAMIFPSGNLSVNTTTEVASSQFNVVSTTRGSLPFPRMTEADRLAITGAVPGLHVYQTDATEGVYVYKSGGWAFAY